MGKLRMLHLIYTFFLENNNRSNSSIYHTYTNKFAYTSTHTQTHMAGFRVAKDTSTY